MKIYISGKMTGLTKKESKAIFAEAEKYLKKLAPENSIINPHDLQYSAQDYPGQMLEALEVLSQCDAIYMLRNWKDSNGAQCEYWFAKGSGLQIIYQDN